MKLNSLTVAKVSIFAALYVATSFVPISIFIGASSMLTLNLIITPTIAILLTPLEAFAASLLGAVISLYAAPFQAIFGPYTILLPVVGATLGSLAYHKPKAGIVASIYLGLVSCSYFLMRPEFPYWITPHIIGAVMASGVGLTNTLSYKKRIPIYAFVSTICEQATMLIGAVFILSLPWVVFATAFPLMLYERFIGTIGGTIIAYSLCLKYKEILPYD